MRRNYIVRAKTRKAALTEASTEDKKAWVRELGITSASPAVQALLQDLYWSTVISDRRNFYDREKGRKSCCPSSKTRCNTMHPREKPASTSRTYADNDRLVCPRHTNLAPHQMWVDPDRLYAPVEGVLLGVTDKIDHGDDILSATISTLLEFGFVERDVHDGGDHQTKRTRHARTLAAKLDYDRMRMREAFTHEQFNATDADGDGKLDLAEFLQFWRTSQNCPDESQPSEEQIKASFSLLDRDGDGRLDVQEFLRFLKSRGLENKSFNQSPFLETHHSPGTSPGKNVDRNWEFDL